MPNFTPAEWAAHYRTLTVPELVARTLHLRLATQRGYAENPDVRFSALEVEQTVRVAEDEAWIEQANRQMEGLEIDGLQLVISASTHRLECGPCPDRARTEIYRQVAIDRLHALAVYDSVWLGREESWARALDGLATPALRDMLAHARGLLDNPPAEWTPYQFGAAHVWAERLTCELATRENAKATV